MRELAPQPTADVASREGSRVRASHSRHGESRHLCRPFGVLNFENRKFSYIENSIFGLSSTSFLEAHLGPGLCLSYTLFILATFCEKIELLAEYSGLTISIAVFLTSMRAEYLSLIHI